MPSLGFHQQYPNEISNFGSLCKGPVDFISLTLENALPIFKFNLGSGTATLKVEWKKSCGLKTTFANICQKNTVQEGDSSRIVFYLSFFVTELICPVEIIVGWLKIARV